MEISIFPECVALESLILTYLSCKLYSETFAEVVQTIGRLCPDAASTSTDHYLFKPQHTTKNFEFLSSVLD